MIGYDKKKGLRVTSVGWARRPDKANEKGARPEPMRDCPNCGGDGYSIEGGDCPACAGRGRVSYRPHSGGAEPQEGKS